MLSETEGLPRCCARRLLDAWNDLQVPQHAPWPGRLPAPRFCARLGRTRQRILLPSFSA
nr:hypothetical protein [Sinorhizobium meliloti]